MDEHGRIDPVRLKRETCAMKATGIPSEEFGRSILGIAWKTSRQFFDGRHSPVDRTDAVQFVALKCCESVRSVRCNQKPIRVFNFFVKLAQRTFTDLYRSEISRIKRIERYAARHGIDIDSI